MTMPSLSPTMERGNIVSWKVGPGDAIKPGDVLAEIETDKATLAFENVSDEGYIARILVPAGSRDVDVGTLVAVVVEDAAEVPAFADYTADGGPAAAAPAPAAAGAAAGAAAAAAPPTPRVVASSRLGPAARMLLEASGLSPSDVTPTGPNNIITKGDVLAAIEAGVKPGSGAAAAAAATVPAAPKAAAPAAAAPAPPKAAPAPAAAAAPAAAKPAAAPAAGGLHTDTPNSQIRRIIAQRLLESKRDTPTMYLAAEARLGGVAELRAALAARGTKVRAVQGRGPARGRAACNHRCRHDW